MDRHTPTADSHSPPTAPRGRPPGSAHRNADYRWTVPKVRAFLEDLSSHGNVAQAARSVGMSRTAAYRLRRRLAGGPWGEAFEMGRSLGLERRMERARSRWEGPPITALLQGDAAARQGDTGPAQGHGPAAKVTL